MSVNSVNGTSQAYEASKAYVPKAAEAKTEAAGKTDTAEKTDTAAATFEKSDSEVKGKSKIDYVTFDKLKADAEARTASLRNLVLKMMKEQGKTYNKSDGLAAMYKGLDVDPKVRLQAQKDIAADGYWGVEQTSDRILSFAKALAGDDPDKADEMIKAVKKGFNLAGKEWGEDLPGICQDTMKATLSKMDEWAKGLKPPAKTE